MNHPYRVAIVMERSLAYSLLDGESYEFLKSFADVNPIEELPETITREFMMKVLPGAQACITCWRTPSFTDEMLDQLPDLKLIAHSAGAVRDLVPASFWQSNRRITSNAPLIAEDVAQTVLALILPSLKQMWSFSQSTREGKWSGGEAGLFSTYNLEGLNVGIVGASKVGKRVAEILRPFGCHLRVWDPMLCSIEAKQLGLELMDLDEMIATSDILTLHAPANPDCRHLLNAKNIPLIKDGALLINTARGMLIDEPALIKELETQRFFACIDVTDPEPPRADHPFRTLPNVVLTPHIAGGHTVTCRKKMGATSVKEVYNYLTKGLLSFSVIGEMLGHMA